MSSERLRAVVMRAKADIDSRNSADNLASVERDMKSEDIIKLKEILRGNGELTFDVAASLAIDSEIFNEKTLKEEIENYEDRTQEEFAEDVVMLIKEYIIFLNKIVKLDGDEWPTQAMLSPYGVSGALVEILADNEDDEDDDG